MSEFAISQIYPTDRRSLLQIDSLLKQEGIKRDSNLDYICAMYDEEHQIVATGSCFANTLRCFAVSSSHQGEGLFNQIHKKFTISRLRHLYITSNQTAATSDFQRTYKKKNFC